MRARRFVVLATMAGAVALSPAVAMADDVVTRTIPAADEICVASPQPDLVSDICADTAPAGLSASCQGRYEGIIGEDVVRLWLDGSAYDPRAKSISLTCYARQGKTVIFWASGYAPATYVEAHGFTITLRRLLPDNVCWTAASSTGATINTC